MNDDVKLLYYCVSNGSDLVNLTNLLLMHKVSEHLIELYYWERTEPVNMHFACAKDRDAFFLAVQEKLAWIEENQ